jgi:acyl-CoA thioester hydrolase
MFNTHTYEIIILEKHLDTFGHVNNATYLEILEEARWDWITRGGFGLKEIYERKMGPTILEIKIRFRKELKLRQKIKIQSHVVKYEGKVGEVEQNILNENGEICCTAHFTIGLFDTVKRKLIEPTPEWLHAVGLSDKS